MTGRDAQEDTMTREAAFPQSLLPLAAMMLALVSPALPSHSEAAKAEKPAWDHVANVRGAAGRLAVMHKREGSPGVLKFLDACYRTHLLASEFNQGLEACMAQDYMHSQVLAQMYSKLSTDQRKAMRAPSAEDIARGMGQRFLLAYSQYHVSPAEADVFRKLVDKEAFPIFLKAVFPKVNAPEGAAADDGKPEKTGTRKKSRSGPGATGQSKKD